MKEDWAYDYGCNSESPLRDAVGFIKKLIRIWNSTLPEPGQPSAKVYYYSVNAVLIKQFLICKFQSSIMQCISQKDGFSVCLGYKIFCDN